MKRLSLQRVLHRKPQPPVGRQPLSLRRQAADRQPPSTFSYHSQRSTRGDDNGRQHASQPRRAAGQQYLLRRSGYVIALLAAGICLISVLSLSTTPRIVLLTSGSSLFHQSGDYQRAAATDLAGSIWNHNKITVDIARSKAQLLQQFPELADVAVALPLVGHRPTFYLKANTPAFIVSAVNGTYVVDSAGKALIAKDGIASSVSADLPVITDQTGNHVVLGHPVLSSTDTDFIRTVLAELSARQVSVTAITLPANAAEEVDMQISGQPYFVKFSMHMFGGARQQSGTYLATAHSLSSQHITPAQYIDVRVSGRAYYQ